MRHNALFRLCLLVIGLMVLLSGCGQTAAGKGNTGGSEKPESVTIEVERPGPGQPRQRVTLHDVRSVQQLYTTIYALPQMPANIACTKELGPHYTLTFIQNQKTLTTVNARREGCRPVIIAGETNERRGSQDFWTQLDQAIQQAAP
ncbi:MAG: hypothetical protein IMW89_09000 [Ktedonobacteraceae bacterium]|nr:hypothetical protein [Ktedonobacteraceae bacterium]